MGKKAELLRDYREKLFPIVDEIPHNSFRNLSPNEFHAQRTETVFPPIERGGESIFAQRPDPQRRNRNFLLESRTRGAQ